jgi:hypothetical protein
VQAIHDASCLLGASCVTESTPDPDDGGSEGANKSVTAPALEAKARLLRMRLG